MLLEKEFGGVVEKLSIVQPEIMMGLLFGGSVVYWFSGASTQAVVTGAYRAVVFIKENIKLDTSTASIEDSKEVVKICTTYAQRGMINIFARSSASRWPCPSSTLLLHRLSRGNRILRVVPSVVHGERRRRMGQREEDCRGRHAPEGHATPRRNRRRRHGRRPVQGHLGRCR